METMMSFAVDTEHAQRQKRGFAVDTEHVSGQKSGFADYTEHSQRQKMALLSLQSTPRGKILAL